MGLRLLAILVLVALAVYVGKRWIEGLRKPVGSEHRKEPQRMTKCPVCGTYLPVTDAVQSGDKFFCSSAHARQFETPED